MGWSLGFDTQWNRDIGYGVPAYCDHPGCGRKIDRGLAHVCAGAQAFGGEHGCGLYFCGRHLVFDKEKGFCCERCASGKEPFKPKPDHPEWVEFKASDPSWRKAGA